MRISSTLSFLFPDIILFISAYYIAQYFTYEITGRDIELFTDMSLVLQSVFLSLIIFFIFKIQVLKFNLTYFKYLLIGLPNLVAIIIAVSTHKNYQLSYQLIFCGILLYYSFILFMSRFICVLTDTEINYRNLFGQSGTIALNAITKLEQKRNLLSVFKEFRLLAITKQTTVSFRDENLDEYVITVYTRAFRNDVIFDKIVENAQKCGNFKIRQYTA